MKKVCPNCGAETEGKFCPDCGTNLTDAVTQDEPAVYEESYPSASENANEGEEVKFDETVASTVHIQEAKEVSVESSDKPAAALAGTVYSNTSEATEISDQIPKQKKAPKKLIAIIVVAVVVIAAAAAAFMFMGVGGSSVISKAYQEGTTEQKIGELTYLLPSSWKLDDTYSNSNAFFDTQRYLVKADDGTDSVDCYVKYCGESRYYGNTLEDYVSKLTTEETVEENLSLDGAEGKHLCNSSSDADGNNSYVDTYIVEANGSIFEFEFNTNDSSHDQNGMNSIVSGAKFSSYKSPVQEAIVGKGKYTDTANAIMRELMSNIKKNNDSENLGCGEFTYYESSTKGGALCYAIQENGFDTGVAISFYKDKKGENAVDSFDEIPVRVTAATTLANLLDYEDTSIALINGTLIQLTGDVKYKQAYSKYVNGISDATGIKGSDFYTNSFSLNDFDYDVAARTKSGEYGVFFDIY